jgi:hypothetical protein
VTEDEHNGRLVINSPESVDEVDANDAEPVATVAPEAVEPPLPDNIAERMQSDLTIADDGSTDD